MAIKKLVKLDHADAQINRVQRNVEDVLSSVQLAFSSGSLVQNLSGTFDAMYGAASQTSSFDQRYILASNFGSFSGALNSFSASADQRYVLTSSFNSYSASINRFTGSADNRYVLTASFGPYTASLDRRYLQTSSLTGQVVTGSLSIASGNLNVTNDSASLQLTSTGSALTYLGLTNALHDWRIYNVGMLAVFDNTVGGYRMRIDTNGNVGIGVSAPQDMLEVGGVVRAQGYRCRTGNAGTYGGNLSNLYWTGTNCQLWIDSTNVGTISTTSDRRLKQNIVSMSGSALNTVAKLNPVTFNWNDLGIFKNDGKAHCGFIADELQRVIPTAVDGAPSGSLADGTPAYQTLIPSEIDPFIVKAIQEISGSLSYLQTTVTALSGTVATLQTAVNILQGKPLGSSWSKLLTFWKRGDD